MDSHGLFGGLWVYFGASFGFCGFFRSGNIYIGVVYFFCGVIPFFVSLRDDLFLSFSLHFFVVVVVGLLFSFSCV